MIMFVSDNGASSEQLIRADGHDASAPPGSAQTHLCLGPGWASAANAPFRLHKSWVHEGGISSPFVVHWPNGFADRGKLRHNACHFVDILPTLVDAGGGRPSAEPDALELAGRSLLPALHKDGTVTRPFLYFHHSNNRALRAADWKLVAAGESGPWELYDMRTDRTESKDLSRQQADRVQKMAALWKQTDEEFVRVREAAKPMPKDRL
jgi:arylsulfatase